MQETRRRPVVLVLAALIASLFAARIASAAPCLIFVHGKRTNTDTFTNWNAARDYWRNGSSDFIQTATRNFSTSYYVVGYKTEPRRTGMPRRRARWRTRS
jgi:hypothetical protein